MSYLELSKHIYYFDDELIILFFLLAMHPPFEILHWFDVLKTHRSIGKFNKLNPVNYAMYAAFLMIWYISTTTICMYWPCSLNSCTFTNGQYHACNNIYIHTTATLLSLHLTKVRCVCMLLIVEYVPTLLRCIIIIVHGDDTLSTIQYIWTCGSCIDFSI